MYHLPQISRGVPCVPFSCTVACEGKELYVSVAVL